MIRIDMLKIFKLIIILRVPLFKHHKAKLITSDFLIKLIPCALALFSFNITVGDDYIVTAVYKNTSGNYWYEVNTAKNRDISVAAMMELPVTCGDNPHVPAETNALQQLCSRWLQAFDGIVNAKHYHVSEANGAED